MQKKQGPDGDDAVQYSNTNCDPLAATALWEEDEDLAEYINRQIEAAMLSGQWGSMRGCIQEQIKASTQKSYNIRRRLSMFRASIISTQRHLTRMRPSRRYGWEQMGATHPYTTRLLIAVDTSGSVLQEDLNRFFSLINSFFSYGIPHVDVIQFDADIHLPLLSMKNVARTIQVRGRGGTDFQPPIDFYKNHPEYDGMIVFTDGQAPAPDIPLRRKILWVLKDMRCYNDCNLKPKVYV